MKRIFVSYYKEDLRSQALTIEDEDNIAEITIEEDDSTF
jgi:hypothetical protein